MLSKQPYRTVVIFGMSAMSATSATSAMSAMAHDIVENDFVVRVPSV